MTNSLFFVLQVYPIMFSIALGFSNGVFGSVPMILAPSRVGREHREIAGIYVYIFNNLKRTVYMRLCASGAVSGYVIRTIDLNTVNYITIRRSRKKNKPFSNILAN